MVMRSILTFMDDLESANTNWYKINATNKVPPAIMTMNFDVQVFFSIFLSIVVISFYSVILLMPINMPRPKRPKKGKKGILKFFCGFFRTKLSASDQNQPVVVHLRLKIIFLLKVKNSVILVLWQILDKHCPFVSFRYKFWKKDERRMNKVRSRIRQGGQVGLSTRLGVGSSWELMDEGGR